MTHLLGNDLKVYMNGVAIAAAKSVAISISNDVTEVSDGNTGIAKTYIMKRSSWTASTSGLVTTLSSFMSLSKTRSKVTLKFTDGETSYIGDAFIKSANISGKVKSLTTYDVSFTGTGELNEQ